MIYLELTIDHDKLKLMISQKAFENWQLDELILRLVTYLLTNSQ